jgi:hypothetical protein
MPLLDDYCEALELHDSIRLGLLVHRTLTDNSSSVSRSAPLDITRSIESSAAIAATHSYTPQQTAIHVRVVTALFTHDKLKTIRELGRGLSADPPLFIPAAVIAVRGVLRRNEMDLDNDLDLDLDLDKIAEALQVPLSAAIGVLALSSSKDSFKSNTVPPATVAAIHVFAGVLLGTHARTGHWAAAEALVKVLRGALPNTKSTKSNGITREAIPGAEAAYLYGVARTQTRGGGRLEWNAAYETLMRATMQTPHGEALHWKLLFLLLPLRALMNGTLPKPEVLLNSSSPLLVVLTPLFDAMRRLDAFKYATLLESDPLIRRVLLQGGVAALYEQLRTPLALRIVKACAEELQSHILPLPVLQAVGVAEADVAALVASGAVRGYVAHTQQALVLSKRAPWG